MHGPRVFQWRTPSNSVSSPRELLPHPLARLRFQAEISEKQLIQSSQRLVIIYSFVALYDSILGFVAHVCASRPLSQAEVCCCSKPRMAHPSIASLGPSARRGARWIARVARRDKDVPSGDRRAQGAKRRGYSRHPGNVLSLVTFFARAKKVTQGAGAEPPAIMLFRIARKARDSIYTLDSRFRGNDDGFVRRVTALRA